MNGDRKFLEGLFRDIVAEQNDAAWGPACPHCDAEIEFTLGPDDPLALHVWIFHDDGCPLCPCEESGPVD